MRPKGLLHQSFFLYVTRAVQQDAPPDAFGKVTRCKQAASEACGFICGTFPPGGATYLESGVLQLYLNCTERTD